MSEQMLQRSHNQFHMVCTLQEDHFLSYLTNKHLLTGTKLVKQGFRVFHCDEDADLMIMLTVVEAAKTQDTVIVGEDTDLLVLLCHYVSQSKLRILQGGGYFILT